MRLFRKQNWKQKKKKYHNKVRQMNECQDQDRPTDRAIDRQTDGLLTDRVWSKRNTTGPKCSHRATPKKKTFHLQINGNRRFQSKWFLCHGLVSGCSLDGWGTDEWMDVYMWFVELVDFWSSDVQIAFDKLKVVFVFAIKFHIIPTYISDVLLHE